MGSKQSLPEVVFEVKLKSKEMARAANRCAKEEKAEKLKVKQAIQKGYKEQAQIFAQNAIRKKNEQLNFLRMSAKMDAVATKLDGAAKTQDISNSIAKTIPQLQKCMKDMSVEDMTVNANEFEKLFEDLDVRTEYMSTAIDSTTATTTPASEVDELIAQVANEHQLDVTEMLMGAGPNASALPTMQAAPGAKTGYSDRQGV